MKFLVFLDQQEKEIQKWTLVMFQEADGVWRGNYIATVSNFLYRQC